MRQMKKFPEPGYAAGIRQPILMVAAGNDTTRYTMTAGAQVFMDHPEIFASIPDMDDAQLKLLVDEVLRWASTTMHFRRTVVEDTELRGQKMKKGDKSGAAPNSTP